MKGNQKRSQRQGQEHTIQPEPPHMKTHGSGSSLLDPELVGVEGRGAELLLQDNDVVVGDYLRIHRRQQRGDSPLFGASETRQERVETERQGRGLGGEGGDEHERKGSTHRGNVY